MYYYYTGINLTIVQYWTGWMDTTRTMSILYSAYILPPGHAFSNPELYRYYMIRYDRSQYDLALRLLDHTGYS